MTSRLLGEIIQQVKYKTTVHNSDNITRTLAYQNYYLKNPEIRWALLASIVSRNAGWNMTDLVIPPIKNMLNEKQRQQLFSTYERANWLIFSDAFPQLLIYQLSKEKGKPLFECLNDFHVSRFMIKEWLRFWETANVDRLVKALIINEQNVIENPVIQQPYFHSRIFHRVPYLLESFLRLNVVIFPMKSGELYGLPIYKFTHIDQRIAIGNTLTDLLFDPRLLPTFLEFIHTVEPVGSREEYEQFLTLPEIPAPPLKQVYPIIQHQDNIREDWHRLRGLKQKWWEAKVPFPESAPKRYYVKKKILLKMSELISLTQR
ncbi:DUF2515 family protein [Thalassobacillus devorans]|uniref:DUF2515 family protein n=1 Tax=Thalassobacillus devorans TaxID=279813 RepID=UPI0004B7103E|nr:DUF2515 family protein [Thalassobacillus devorans]